MRQGQDGAAGATQRMPPQPSRLRASPVLRRSLRSRHRETCSLLTKDSATQPPRADPRRQRRLSFGSVLASLEVIIGKASHEPALAPCTSAQTSTNREIDQEVEEAWNAAHEVLRFNAGAEEPEKAGRAQPSRP